MGRRLLILFLMLATAVTTGAIAVGVSNDLVTNCDEGHTWEDSSVLVEADCTTEGVLLQECSVCGEKQEVAIDALGHEYGEFTSNGNGTHSKVCANDDDHVVTENCSGGEATCTEKATCSVCGEKYGTELLHTYNVEKATAEYLKEEATCVTKAQYYYSCECGAKDVRWFEYGEYAPHVYEYEIAEPEHLKTPADCTHDAVYYLSCECTASGDDAYTFVAEGTMGEHNFQNTTVKDATTLVSEATCTAHAVYKYTCTGCDAIGTETYEGEILDHEMTYHAAVEATCKVEGFVEYWACATCSKNYDAEQGGTEIENVSLGLNANNHKNVVVTKEAQASTCTVAGWTKEETCNDCNVVVTVSEALELASHSEVTTTENEVEATCTTAGSYDTVVTCSVCTTELSRVNTVVDALGHECSTTEANTCVRCDKVFTVAEIVEMAQGLANDTALTGKYELTGVITKIDTEASTYYQNVSVIIEVENGDNDLSILCFRLKGEGYDVIAVGDNITVEGIIKNYNGTIEFDAGCVIVSSLHTITLGEIDTTKGNATLSVNEQVALGTTVDVEIDLVKGYAVESVLVNGVAVTTYEGNVFSFVVEKSSTVVVNFKEAGAESETPESTATLTFDSDKENRTEYSTEKQVWSQNGVTLTNNKANSTNNVGDYTAPGRFYKSSEVIISFTQKMTKIVIDASGASYATPYQASIQDYTVTVDGKMVTIDLGEGVESITFTTTAQVRANSITVYYVDENAAPAHTHVPGTAVEENRVEATCTTAGSYDEVVYCTDITCMGEISRIAKSIDVDTINGHDYVAGTPVAPTCTADGYTTYTCTRCSDSYDVAGESKLGHSETNVSYVVNAEDDTKHDKICGECSQVIETLGHDYVAGTPVAPTCTEDGYTPYTCDDCEHTYNEAGESKLGHSETNVSYRVNTEDSTKHDKVCGVCSQVVETSAHVDTNPVDNKCDFCEITICEHEWSDWTSNGDNTHTRKCTKDESHTETVDCAGGEATCTEKAVCADCGTAYGEANGHDFPETWDSIGNDKHSHTCENCSETEEENCAGGNATCVDKAVCVKCLTAYGELANHEYGDLVEKVDATCSKEGMEAHYFCDVCDTYFDAEKNETTAEALTIDKDPNAHAYGEWTTVDGNHSRVCANDNTHTESGACADENADDKCDVCSADMPVALVEKTLSFASADQRVSSSTTEQVWKQNGITLVYAKGSYNNNLADYNNPIRFYAGTQITITAGTGVKKVVINCNTDAYATTLKDSIGDSATISGKVVTVELADLQESYTFSPSGSQVRVDSIVVTFKECAHANTETIETTPATCETAGVTGGVYCNDCETYVSGGEKIDALGHSYTTWTAVDGTSNHTSTCANGCGTTDTKAHTYGDDNICTANGCGAEKPADAPTLTEKNESMTVVGTSGTMASDSSSISWTSANFTVTNYKGGTAIRTTDSDHYRVYANSELEISGSNITKVVITATSSSYATVLVNAFNAVDGCTASANGSVVTITIDDAAGVDSIKATVSAQTRISKVEVTYLG